MFKRCVVVPFAFLLASPACSAEAPAASNQQDVKADKKEEPKTEASPATPAPTPSTPPNTETRPPPEEALPTCCSGKGTCVPEDVVTSEQKSYLTQKECAAKNLCAPTENLSPSFKPTACTGGLDGKTKGVCLSNCLELPSKQFLDQGTCDKEHTCAPCVHPITKQPTGAPGCS